ncbi:MAG: ATPase [Candidatus Marinimicrobia bacterium]|nr:ATPase [Candidatus Neomarinimicrobiota bacterium]|tara:strand:+ start:3531 stop:4886 length:1356 start_codon:yes stop_codon:yes gene_type:complete
MSNITRIGNGQGFWGDSIEAPINLLKYGNLDYLTLDYLAEVTMSIMQRQKLKNPDLGYAKDFIDMFESSINLIKRNNVKVISNAGGVNPKSCSNKLIQIAKNSGNKLKIGFIEGDDIFNSIDELKNKGVSFNNLETGESFERIRDLVTSANVYIGSFPISEALEMGAEVVLAGRVSDPGLVLGPAIHEFGWVKDNINRIASGTLAGHILECGAQCTGGNYSKWWNVPDLVNIGYPIAEINSYGDFIITKPKGSGGLVNKETICEQILYEMGNPKKYISPDICVDFTSFDLEDLGQDKVHINNVKGFKATDTYKVAISYFAGYKASGQLTISGPKALEKAKLTANIIWKRLENIDCTFEDTSTEFLGFNSCHKDISVNNDNPSEIVLRLGVKDKNKKKVDRFGKEIAPVITNGPPGITGFSGGRPKAQPIVAYWPTLIPKELIQTKVTLITS